VTHTRNTARLRRFAGLAIVTLLASGLAACTTGSDAVKIALLLPESKTARYEAFDRPFFEQRIG